MSHSIDQFITNFNGGFRSNHFIVSITKGYGGALPDLTYHARATTLPASTMSVLNIPYRGRVFKAPGVRTYATWQLTILNDKLGQNQDAYTYFQKWSNAINGHDTNTTLGSGNSSEADNLLGTFNVQMLDYNGNPLGQRKWTLKYAWPAQVGAVTLDMENNDSPLSTFVVDIEYSEAEVSTSIGTAVNA